MADIARLVELVYRPIRTKIPAAVTEPDGPAVQIVTNFNDCKGPGFEYQIGNSMYELDPRRRHALCSMKMRL